MKVRLKHEIDEAVQQQLYPFQFHEGPIKTSDHTKRAYRLTGFQFHEGPIKTHCIFQ